MAVPSTPGRVVYDVTYDARRRGWKVMPQGSTNAVARASTKDAAVRAAVTKAKTKPLAQVRIHTKDGRIQSERTYPRSSDPRRTPG